MWSRSSYLTERERGPGEARRTVPWADISVPRNIWTSICVISMRLYVVRLLGRHGQISTKANDGLHYNLRAPIALTTQAYATAAYIQT